jgi:restriction system protein
MTVPNYETIMLPLLRMSGADLASDLPTAEKLLAEEFSLSPEDRSRRLPSGQQTVLRNRVGWASFYLKGAGLLDKPRRGFFQITERGRDVLRDPPVAISRDYLMRFPEFVEFVTRSNEEDSRTTGVLQSSVVSNQTPDEIFQVAYSAMRAELAREVLDKLLSASPDFFEEVVVELLVAMGYGGSRKDAGERIGKSGDGGIDGIIKEDKLGLDAIYIQAKRWQGSVGRPEIQKFVGALQGQRARKGVFMTTSAFSADAIDYVSRVDVKVVLLDGKTIAGLMIDHNVGVSSVTTYVVKRLDSDYFDEA